MLICCISFFSSPCCNVYFYLCKDPAANQTLHSYEAWLSSIFLWMKAFAILPLVLPFGSQGFPFLAQWDWRRKRPCAKCPSFCHLTYCLTSWVKMTLWPRAVYSKMDLMQLVTIGAKKCPVTRQDSVYLMKT